MIMDAELTLKNWRRSRKAETVQFKFRVDKLKESADTISQLPEELSYSNIDSTTGLIILSAICATDK